VEYTAYAAEPEAEGGSPERAPLVVKAAGHAKKYGEWVAEKSSDVVMKAMEYPWHVPLQTALDRVIPLADRISSALYRR
jgi:hypothetical protein